ncbi:hypothetical protein [Enterovibrio nigricans]|uniref:Uncharacterized protein n=1 Tax=Enterovibrio nigricans DSM 22720 TaxID=1121868 RepID=A0A1T4U2I5_9GAMM|nr:hypothetical protein [Enterovibrio nigricans]PKF51172.1 hypothetical protein AT251_06195 [Enterovibrio nigricans]SKA46718.1 hypothetical protein SAMN02745132_00601 [Enterovibrio nigricans DSM 22720]
MLDRLDFLQKHLPSGEHNRVVPVYMFTTDQGLPVILRVNIGNARDDVPVALMAFDIDAMATTVRCEVQYPTENTKLRLYGRLTGKRFTLGTTEIDNWSTLETLLKANLEKHQAVPTP